MNILNHPFKNIKFIFMKQISYNNVIKYNIIISRLRTINYETQYNEIKYLIEENSFYQKYINIYSFRLVCK